MSPELAEALARHYGGGPYVDVRAAAEILGLSKSLLDKMRLSGDGPAFCRFRSAVRYSVAELLRWAEARKCAA